MKKITKLFLLLTLVLPFTNCGDFAISADIIKPRWDLSKPIYIAVVLHDGMNNLPHAAGNLAALKTAIQTAGGTVSDIPVDQVIYLDNSDAPPCDATTSAIDAHTPLPDDRTIVVCHSTAVLATYTQEMMDAIMRHELGHLLGNRGGHLMDGISIMCPNATARTEQKTYTEADIEYICRSRNSINGICGN